MLINAPQCIQNIHVDLYKPGRFLVSDHHVVAADVVFSTSPSTTPPLNYARANLQGLASNVAVANTVNSQSTRSSPVRPNADVNIQWNIFKQGNFNACETFVIRAGIPHKCTPKWYNPCIRHQLNKVRSLKRRIRLCPMPFSKNQLVNLESSVCLLMDKAKRIFYKAL